MNAGSGQYIQIPLWPPSGQVSASPDSAFILDVGPSSLQSGIYGIKNLANGKWYIGQSTDLSRIKNDHFSYLIRNHHCNEHLQKAFNKYGKNSFKFYILEKTSENILDERECDLIVFYKSNQPKFGYNIDSGGNKNKHFSDEHKRKIAEASKKHRHSEKVKIRLSEIRRAWWKKYYQTPSMIEHYKKARPHTITDKVAYRRMISRRHYLKCHKNTKQGANQ
jgi:group I intron endonuclease